MKNINHFKTLLFFIFLCFPLVSLATMPVIDYSRMAQAALQFEQIKEEIAAVKSSILQEQNFNWSDNTNRMSQMASILNQLQSLSYAAGNLDQQFRKLYPGYQSSQDYSQDYKDRMQSTLNTINGVLQTTGMTMNEFQDQSDRLKALQNMAQGTQGQTQIMQVNTEVLSALASGVQMMHQTFLAQSNAQTSYMATQIQNEESKKAEFDGFVSSGSQDVPAYGTKSQINIPDVS